MKKEKEPPMDEFRFHYHLGDATESSDKFFIARNFQEASDMFDYACRRKHLQTQVSKVEQWNRWANKWETVENPSNLQAQA